jgi:Glutaredoxin 2
MIEMPFSNALSQTKEHVVKVEAALNQLPTLPLPSDHGNSISWDDVLIYPTLRNLTMVRDLSFPERVSTYIKEVSALTNTHTYHDKAS